MADNTRDYIFDDGERGSDGIREKERATELKKRPESGYQNAKGKSSIKDDNNRSDGYK